MSPREDAQYLGGRHSGCDHGINSSALQEALVASTQTDFFDLAEVGLDICLIGATINLLVAVVGLVMEL